jgi:hypothetical protein
MNFIDPLVTVDSQLSDMIKQRETLNDTLAAIQRDHTVKVITSLHICIHYVTVGASIS